MYIQKNAANCRFKNSVPARTARDCFANCAFCSRTCHVFLSLFVWVVDKYLSLVAVLKALELNTIQFQDPKLRGGHFMMLITHVTNSQPISRTSFWHLKWRYLVPGPEVEGGHFMMLITHVEHPQLVHPTLEILGCVFGNLVEVLVVGAVLFLCSNTVEDGVHTCHQGVCSNESID